MDLYKSYADQNLALERVFASLKALNTANKETFDLRRGVFLEDVSQLLNVAKEIPVVVDKKFRLLRRMQSWHNSDDRRWLEAGTEGTIFRFDEGMLYLDFGDQHWNWVSANNPTSVLFYENWIEFVE